MDAATGGAAPQLRVRSRVWIVVLVYLGLTLWWLWPLPARWSDHASYPNSRLPSVEGDFNLITWALAWDTHALLSQPSRLFDANIFFPAPSPLAFSEHFLGYLPLFAPTYLATGNPVLASNVLIFLTYPLCALAMYALARRFVSPPAALLAGAAYAFYGLRYHNLFHFHQFGVFYFPLAIVLTERWLERARTSDAALLAAALALQLLSSYYLAYALAALYAAYLVVALWRWRCGLDRRRLLGLAGVLAVATLPFVVASLPYLDLQRLGVIPSANGEEIARLYSMNPRLTMLQIEQYLTRDGVGIVGYVLSIVALLSGWSRGAYARVLGIVLCVVGLLLAAGPRIDVVGYDLWSPYILLVRWIPGFAVIRLPARFLVIAQLGFALLAALGLERLLTVIPRSLAWPAGVVSVVLLLLMPGPLPAHTLHQQQTAGRVPELYGWLAEHGDGGVLLELPPGDNATASRRMVMSTHHWLPSIDGYSAYPPPTRKYLRRIASGLPSAAALQDLVNVVDVRWIVVHLGELDPAARRRWEETPPAGLVRVERWDSDVLFRVELAPTLNFRERLVSTTETMTGARLAPLADCPGRIRARVRGTPTTLRPTSKYQLEVVLENRGHEPWPGFSMYPRYLIRLRVTTRPRDDVTRTPNVALIPLWRDVPAAADYPLTTWLSAPQVPGDYVLELSLVQDDIALDRCGVPSLRLPVRVAALDRG